jgi:hypothetical protein
VTGLPPGPITLLTGEGLRRAAAAAFRKSGAQVRDAPPRKWDLWAASLQERLFAYMRYAGDAAASRERAAWFEKLEARAAAFLEVIPADQQEDWAQQHFLGAVVSFAGSALLQGEDLSGSPFLHAAYLDQVRAHMEIVRLIADFGAAIEREQAGVTGRRSRPPDIPRHQLISELARAFEWATGQRARSGWDEYEDRRTGPFVRFVQAILGAAQDALPETEARKRRVLDLTPAEILGPMERGRRHTRQHARKSARMTD